MKKISLLAMIATVLLFALTSCADKNLGARKGYQPLGIDTTYTLKDGTQIHTYRFGSGDSSQRKVTTYYDTVKENGFSFFLMKKDIEEVSVREGSHKDTEYVKNWYLCEVRSSDFSSTHNEFMNYGWVNISYHGISIMHEVVKDNETGKYSLPKHRNDIDIPGFDSQNIKPSEKEAFDKAKMDAVQKTYVLAQSLVENIVSVCHRRDISYANWFEK